MQRKANGVDISIDASELEGMSEDELRKRYDQHSRGSAGVPGAGNREDFSDMIAKEMHKKNIDKARNELGCEGEVTVVVITLDTMAETVLHIGLSATEMKEYRADRHMKDELGKERMISDLNERAV